MMDYTLVVVDAYRAYTKFGYRQGATLLGLLFEAWHPACVAKGYEFNFRAELQAYCNSDVRLLKEGCLTIASACNRDLIMNPMQPDTLASTPSMVSAARPTTRMPRWNDCCGQNRVFVRLPGMP